MTPFGAPRQWLFNASASTIPPSEITKYEWQWNDRPWTPASERIVASWPTKSTQTMGLRVSATDGKQYLAEKTFDTETGLPA